MTEANSHPTTPTTAKASGVSITGTNVVPLFPMALPTVFERNGAIFTNSRDVAACFGKRHDNVLRDIGNLVAELTDGGLLNFEGTPNFGEAPYVDPQNGQTYKSYDLTKNGFVLLVMGFTGRRALHFKTAYIRRFDEMEAALGQQFLEQMLEQVVGDAAPKVTFYDDFAASGDVFNLQNAARVLQQPPNKFCSYLEKARFLFRQNKILVPYAKYVAKGLFVVKLADENSSHQQTYMTAKGIQYYAKHLSVAPAQL